MKYLFVIAICVVLSCQDPSLLLPDLSTGEKSLGAESPATFVSPKQTLFFDLSSSDTRDGLFVDIRDEGNDLLKSEPLIADRDSKLVGYLVPSLNIEGLFTVSVRTALGKALLSQKILYSKQSLNIKSVNVLPVYSVVQGKSVLKFELTDAPSSPYWARFTLLNKTVAYQKFSERVSNLFFDTPLLPGTYEVKVELFPAGLQKVDDSIRSSLSTKTNLVVTDSLYFSRKQDDFGPRFLYSNLYLFEGESMDWSISSDRHLNLNANQFLSTNGESIGIRIPQSGTLHPISWNLLAGGIPERQIIQFSAVGNGIAEQTLIESVYGSSTILKLEQIEREKFLLTMQVGSREEKTSLVILDQGQTQNNFTIGITESSNKLSGFLKINSQVSVFSFSDFDRDTSKFKESASFPIEMQVARDSHLLSVGKVGGTKLLSSRNITQDWTVELSSNSNNSEFSLLPVCQGESLSYEIPGDIQNVSVLLRSSNETVLSTKQYQASNNNGGKLTVLLDGKNLKLNLNGAKSNFSLESMPLFANVVVRTKIKSNEIDYTVKKNK